MRALLVLALSAVLAMPSSADARSRTRGAPGRRSSLARVAPVHAPAPPLGVGPAPLRTAARFPGPYPRRPYRYPAGPIVFSPFYPVPSWWLGWGWGFGYYAPYYAPYPPYYAPYYPPPPVGEYGPVEPERIATTFSAHGAGTSDSRLAGITLGIEGRRAGFDASVDALAMDSIAGSHALGSSSAVGRGTVHVTWALVAHRSARIRAELGGSFLSMPTGGAAAGAPWEGKLAFGPDVGLSGNLGLSGPLGIEGHARVTPTPVLVTDLKGGLALRAGPIALTGGWRAIHVDGNGVDAPSIRFAGPEVGLAFLF